MFVVLSLIQGFPQLDYRTGWQQDSLYGNPSKVLTSIYQLTEKFGEPVEILIVTEETTYNQTGQYLEKKLIDLRENNKYKTTKYSYDTNSGCLINVDFKTQGFNIAPYTNTYQWNNGIISSQTSVVYGHGEFQTEYKHDNLKRNIEATKSRRNSIVEIWHYLYNDKNLIELKKFDNKGFLTNNIKYTYDSKGNIIQFDEFFNKELYTKIIFEYNNKNNITKETKMHFGKPDNGEYWFYMYEYFPSGLIKKISKYLNRRVEFGDGRVTFKEDFISRKEFKYDNHNNWIEKIEIIWDYNNNEFKPISKVIRRIEYYNIPTKDNTASEVNKIEVLKNPENTNNQISSTQRDPRAKDVANVFWNPDYTLFCLLTDEPIFPNSDGKYDIWYSSNENPNPYNKVITKEELPRFLFYKFKDYETCKKWCDSKKKN